MRDTFHGCFGRLAGAIRLTDSTSNNLDHSQAEAAGHARAHCIFCHATAQNGFQIVWEDDTYEVFYDYRPAAARHLLVIPKRHIESVKSLVTDDVIMLKEMEEIGHRILDEMNVPRPSQRLGFHIPPFTSVKHLHLHAQGLPYKPWFFRLRFLIVPGRSGREKGLSWFVEIGQAINILAKGSRIRVLPC